MTIEDGTGAAYVAIWQKMFEAFRRTILGAGMVGIRAHIQREGEVHLFDL